MLSLFKSPKYNGFIPQDINMDLIREEAKEINHMPCQDICIVHDCGRYIDLLIYNEWVTSSFRRFVIAEDYYWNYEEERAFDKLVCSESVGCDCKQIRHIYEKYAEIFPAWQLKFYGSKPLRLFDHIRNCLQTGTAKEILYKAGLDEIAAGMANIDEYNLIGSSPPEIFNGLSMRTLRKINNPSGVILISNPSKRERLFGLQNRYSWLFDDFWNESMCQYMNELILEEENLEDIARKFRRKQTDLKGIWSQSYYYIWYEKDNIREKVERKIGKKLFAQIEDEYKLYQVYDMLVNRRDYWNARLIASNKERTNNLVYCDKKYSVDYPQNIDDFVYEAIVQHNCLLGYLEDYVDNNTEILFLRKREECNSSFVTVEIYQNEILQAYGRFDKKPDEDVLQWLNTYAEIKKLEFYPEYLRDE